MSPSRAGNGSLLILHKESDEDDAIAYAEKYSKEHDGYVIRLKLRIWCKELNRVKWCTIISFYNGCIFSNSLIFKTNGYW